MVDGGGGWQGEGCAGSAQGGYEYLLKEYPAINRAPTINRGATVGPRFIVGANRPQITVSGHAHLDVGWMWPYWRTRQKIAHTVSNVLGLMERYPPYHYSQSQPQLLQCLRQYVLIPYSP